MKFQKQIDALHKIRLQLSGDLREELEDAILELEDEIREDADFLNDIDSTNAIEVLETAYDYVPGNYRVVLVSNINAEQELKDFVKDHPFMDLLRDY